MNWKTWKSDVPAAVVVFLVALPLCLGIALASGAPLIAGITTGIVGGIVAGALSGSSLAVSGPAAGLAVVVLTAIEGLGGYSAFAAAVVAAGAIQVGMGAARLGVIGHFIPNSVIKGMLAAIGIILILKQIPHAVGWDANPEGEMSFLQPDGETTFSALWALRAQVSYGALCISALSAVGLIVWARRSKAGSRFFKMVPGALAVVAVGSAINALYGVFVPEWQLAGDHLVQLPVVQTASELWAQLPSPKWGALTERATWGVALTLALIASLETLLSIEATDKLDSKRRVTPTNRELFAQGVGNMVAGALGGLPMTAVIVRSTANVDAGGDSKASAVMHGFLLLASFLLIPTILNLIPLSALAAILIFIGVKLSHPRLWMAQFKEGADQFVPFAVTVVAILLTDLLVGIIVGICVGLAFVLKTSFHTRVQVTAVENRYLIRFRKDVSFLNKAHFRTTLAALPPNSDVIVDGTRAEFVDHDIIETLEDFVESAPSRGIRVEIKRTPRSGNAYFRQDEQPMTRRGLDANEDLPKALAGEQGVGSRAA